MHRKFLVLFNKQFLLSPLVFYEVTNPSGAEGDGSAFSFNAGCGVISALETALNDFSLFTALANDNWFLFYRYQKQRI